MNYSKTINELEDKINTERILGNDITPLIEKQLECFLAARNEFKEMVKLKGIENSLDAAEIEIGQLEGIVMLLKKLKKPYHEYEILIQSIKNNFVGDNISIEIE